MFRAAQMAMPFSKTYTTETCGTQKREKGRKSDF